MPCTKKIPDGPVRGPPSADSIPAKINIIMSNLMVFRRLKNMSKETKHIFPMFNNPCFRVSGLIIR